MFVILSFSGISHYSAHHQPPRLPFGTLPCVGWGRSPVPTRFEILGLRKVKIVNNTMISLKIAKSRDQQINSIGSLFNYNKSSDLEHVDIA